MKLTIYGASDDLLEIESDTGYRDEFDVPGDLEVEVVDPDGFSLIIRAAFGEAWDSDWTLAIRNSGKWPDDWTIQFGERPDREGDPALILTVPEGTVVRELDS